MFLVFEDLDGSVRLTGCREVAGGIAAVLRGWTMREVPPDAAPVPRVRVRRTVLGYRCVSPRLSKPSRCRDDGFRRNWAGATCILHSELIRWYLEAHPSLLCLHCGAVEFAGGLVIFSGHYRAGKSTLAVRLAAAGARVFCDDVLPIEPRNNFGFAPGFTPRLRLPLAEDTDPALARFIDARRGPENRANLYVDLREDELAPLGETAPIHGIVALEREPGAAPRLTPAEDSEILKRVILRNIARDVTALDVLDRCLAIVEAARCFTLRYADGAHAVDLLQREFGAAPAGEAAA